MYKFFLVLLAVGAMSQVSQAQEINFEQDVNFESEEMMSSMSHLGEELEWRGGGRPGRGGGWGPGPGRPGPGRPGPHPGPGRPGPRPGPPGPRPPSYPPQPPPHYRTEYVTCGAWDYRYNECYVSPYRIQSVRLYTQHSYDACIYGRTFGFNYDRIWTSGGCRATFAIDRY